LLLRGGGAGLQRGPAAEPGEERDGGVGRGPHPSGAATRPSLAAIFTRSGSEPARIFRITLPRWAFTVISLMPSSPPTCLFSRPATTSAITCRSREVSDA